MRLSARNIASKSTSPWPGETKSQPRPGWPKSTWPPRIEERPSSRRLESLTWAWKMRVAELVDEGGGVEELVLEVAGVEVDPEAGAVADRRQRLARGQEVVGDLGRVDLEREAHALGLEDVDDRPPALGELLIAALDRREVVGRERVEEVPDRRAGEAGDDVDAELRRGPRGVHHPLGRPLPHAFGLAVAPDLGREHRPVAVVDRVADGLADEVLADRPAAQPVALEQRPHAGRVARVARAPPRRRSGRPSTRARGRRSPSRRTWPPAPPAAGPPTGR